MIAKEYMTLGSGNGAHGLRATCDACGAKGPFGMEYAEVCGRLAAAGFSTIQTDLNGRPAKAHLCKACMAEWPPREKCSEFIQRKRSKRR